MRMSMRRRVLFLPTLLLPLVIVHWLGSRASLRSLAEASVRPVGAALSGSQASKPATPDSGDESTNRRNLLEALDRLVHYERYYRSVYGHYTRLIANLGCPLPEWLVENYDIHVTEAGSDHLVISARSEEGGRLKDLVSLDQDYVVHANFPLPEPSLAFLRSVALRQLRRVQQSAAGAASAALQPEGLYASYFRYETREDSQSRPIAVAIGLKDPVQGLRLEWSPGAERVEDQLMASLGGLGGSEGRVGEGSLGKVGAGPGVAGIGGLSTAVTRWIRGGNASSVDAVLAQRIFEGETGRLARNWAELAQVTSFRFDPKQAFAAGSAGPGSSGSHASNSVGDAPRSPAAQGLSPHRSADGLQIEPVSPDDL